MMQVKFLSVILLLALSLPFTYGGCSGGGGDGGGDPCAGPVPCLTDFGDTYYEFVDQLGDSAIVISDGIDVGFVGIYYDPDGDPYMIVIIGPVVSCHDGDMIQGAIDWNMNGEIEEGELLEPMDGGLNICNETLSLFDLFLLGESWHDHEWTYVGSGPLIEGIMTQEKAESPRDFLHELIQILNEK
jgi:hypothetical protein